MKYVFLFYFISPSCYNSSLKENKAIASSLPSSQTSVFVCDYSNYKQRSNHLLKQYKKDPDPIRKQTLIKNIRDSVFACWIGTPWDFYGTTEEPGKGKIACGYFVTTVLRDIGVAVNRIKHAQCASEEMIKAVCSKNTVQRYSNVSISSFIGRIKLNGVGLYIVGLDYHTGFILNDGEDVYFVHANYAGKKEVMKEIAIESTVLSSSSYKVIGKLF